MIKTARFKSLPSQALLIAIIAAFMHPQSIEAAAGSPSTCITSQNCTVGEFVYDDSYNKVTNATCSLESRYPDGSVFLNIGSITATSDGWYGYSFTGPSTEGYYRTQLCCVVDGQNMCLDKSFEVKSSGSGGPTATEIADAVWNYSGRTLSGFGTLASDIWNYSGRTLTSFGSLVSNIWSYATRTLTGSDLSSGSLATKSDVENLSSTVSGNSADIASLVKTTNDIKKTTEETRLILEKLVNKPIIQNFIEEDNISLNSKLDQTKSVAESIFINSQFVRSKSSILAGKWNSLSTDEILDILMDLKKTVGERGDTDSSSSLFGQVNWLKNSWGWKEAEDAADQILAIDSTISSVQNMVASSGKSVSSYREIKGLAFYLDTLEKMIGNVSDKQGAKSIYGKIDEIQTLALALDKNEAEVDKTIASLNSINEKEIDAKSSQLTRNILSINRIPKALLALSSKAKDASYSKQLKNKLLGLKALIAANRLYLAKGPKTAFANTWLEEGSIVFKSLITNPSNIVSQKVPVKYYLPPEVKEEDILEVDEGLSVKYDTEKDQYYVEGEFELAAGETKTLAVRVDDIWVISKDQVESLRKQAEELSRPLEKTAYFAQGVTLKSDINVSLDKILSLQSQANTPEQKIKAYREAQIELNSVNQKMDSLKTLVSQASSAGAYLGFVGGAQVLTVWGIVAVVVAGFVLLLFYLRASKKIKKVKKEEEVASREKSVSGHSRKALKGFIPFIMVAILSSLVSAFVVRQVILKSSKVQNESSENQKLEVVKNETQSKVLSAEDENGKGGEEIVRVSAKDGQSVKVKEKPDIDAKTIYEISSAKELTKIDQAGGWIKVVLKDEKEIKPVFEGWVLQDFVSSADAGN